MLEKLLQIAHAELGVCEDPKGSNKGKRVEQYLAAVGLPGGYAWCMAFVVWCFKQAGITKGLIVTGGVKDAWNRAAKANKVTSGYKPGDILIFCYGNDKWHTGLLVEVQGNILKSIDGNTNTDGNREGYEVCLRERGVNSPVLVGAIRLIK